MEGSSKGLRKGTWTTEEDGLLRQCIEKYGEGKWHQVPIRAGLNRCRKSCRLRWLNYLKPSIKRGKLSSDEVDLVLRLHKLLGNRWSLIAGRLPNRTANDVKNYWNTHLSKKRELCCTRTIKERNIACSLTTPTQKHEVLKPRARSFRVNNGCSHLKGLPDIDVSPPCLGLSNFNNICENNITCKKDELENKLMDRDNKWWDSILEESQESDALGPEATPIEKGAIASSAFDYEQIWNLFEGETVELV